MPFSVLIDTVRCIGCQGCQVACKSWNDMPGERTALGETLGNPARLNDSTYTIIGFTELELPTGVSWHFTKKQCMHCLEPACVSACPVGALTRSADGPVVYHKRLCIGCRYCMLACPFEIPKFEWDMPLPYISKCTFCSERLASGLEPACTKACPSGALVFGVRGDVVQLAKRRIAMGGGRYTRKIYGLTEAGGTSWLYITDTAFSEIGINEDISGRPYGSHTWDALSKTPAAGLGVAALLAGLSLIIGRRVAISGPHEDKGGEG